MNKTYNAIIIEDDIKSLKLISYYIKEYCSTINLCDTASNINEGITLIKEKRPDILFLDIMINDDLIFDLLDVINHLNFQIIFISSVEKHTIKAFKYSPVDYLLKPFKITDLLNSVERAIDKIELTYLSKKNNIINHLAVSSGQEIVIIKIADIIYCESQGNYTIFHTSDSSKIMALNNIGTFEDKLPKSFFFRIHKKYIINFDYVKTIYKSDGFYCHLTNNIKLPIARRQQAPLQKALRLK